MLSKDFEIYYYSDTNPPSVAAHAHDYYEFYLFLEGRAQMEIRGAATPLQPGDLVLIPPGVMHHALTARDGTPYRRFVFWVSRAYAGKLLDESPDYVFLMQQAAIGRSIWHLDTAERNTAQARILALLEEIHLDRYGKSAAVSLGVNGLILWLNRTIYEREHPRQEVKGAELVDNLIAWLDQHASEEITLDQLADTFYVSKYYLAHSFKETLGLSIHQYSGAGRHPERHTHRPRLPRLRLSRLRRIFPRVPAGIRSVPPRICGYCPAEAVMPRGQYMRRTLHRF